MSNTTNPSITVYTSPGCMRCRTVMRMFSRANVPYQIVDLNKEPELVQRFRDMGATNLPNIVIHGGFDIADDGTAHNNPSSTDTGLIAGFKVSTVEKIITAHVTNRVHFAPISRELPATITNINHIKLSTD